ncbi:branched-chain amino acid ABC transporter permease [Herbaspirillum seropedicae]|uniref:ABC-type branched-chain amino acid transport system, permease component protein n=1 Tax=Herbaspirillum seropedicae (strain SmR1) TaxID=757424 RepID=D8IXZ4_HERSS|nr:branched-chain amino acid ABC transporter permease [Herbaspirillum seropedicae]ADJ66116.1 ABC-type branched-chain amino acid transport system, permease component protein [Herbaspirillum seropedicae SmR1]AKN67873.1 ABC transporter permease [Herbaspirillum seropedicae]AON57049.1 branched-chain amino acid ABC transporter permease [Herbaspirillum seropedicae]MDR6397801.1 branched-chain amino acid transport system permease protein [Herbaspirillum seropedicae]NQE29907.1 ABC transporter permease [
MNIYLLQIANGVGIGMLYFLLAVGLSIVFGLLRFVNFSHGAFFLLGAYLCFQVTDLGLGFWWSLLIAPLVVGLFAWIVERFVLRHVYALPHHFHILFTVGMALVIQEAVISTWGPLGNNVAPPDLLQGVVMWGGFVYPKYRLFVIGLTAVMALLLWWVLEGTRLGSIVRAGSESTEMVSLLGLNINRIFSLVFALGAATAGLAGALAAPIRGADPFMGVEALGIAFVVVVIGGLGSFWGALIGGILVGIVQSVMSTVWSEGAHLMIYVAMAAVMLLRPNGLLGRPGAA